MGFVLLCVSGYILYVEERTAGITGLAFPPRNKCSQLRDTGCSCEGGVHLDSGVSGHLPHLGDEKFVFKNEHEHSVSHD